MLPLKNEYEWVGKYTCVEGRSLTKFPKFYPPCPVFLVATWQQINKIKHLRKKSGNKWVKSGNNRVNNLVKSSTYAENRVATRLNLVGLGNSQMNAWL